MLARFVLLLIGLLIATQTTRFGEHLSPLILDGVSPYTWLYGAGITLSKVVAWAVMGVSGLMTVLLAIDGVLDAFKKRPLYLYRGTIAVIMLTLMGASFAYGVFVTPYGAYSGKLALWLLQYPNSLALWLVIAPTLLGMLNVGREVVEATRQYEERHGSTELDDLKKTIADLDAKVSGGAATSYSIVKELSGLSSALQTHRDAFGKRMGVLESNVINIAIAVGYSKDEKGDWAVPGTALAKKVILLLQATDHTYNEITHEWDAPPTGVASDVSRIIEIMGGSFDDKKNQWVLPEYVSGEEIKEVIAELRSKDLRMIFERLEAVLRPHAIEPVKSAG